jgi:hypothetical protein
MCAVLAVSLTSCRALDDAARHPTSNEQPSSQTTPPASATALPSAPAALAQLDRLKVVSRRPFIPGYQRSCEHGAACVFGTAWSDNPHADGCSTRQDLLKAALTDVVMEHDSRCAVESGHLVDPYSGAAVNFRADDPDSIEVDHALPLVTGWALGAARWTQQQRVTFANDSSIELVAVSRASNQAKGDSGPAQYQPRIGRCIYDARLVAVLTKYHLPVIAADKTAMTTVLRACS